MNKYIYVTDNTGDLRDATRDTGPWANSLPLLVSSVGDMAAQILDRLGGERIQHLLIAGDGRPGYQSVGALGRDDTMGMRSLQRNRDGAGLLGPAAHHLRRLIGHFAPGARVTLGGTRVGQDTILLQLISLALAGVVVQAGIANYNTLAPGISVRVRECTSQSSQERTANWL